MKLEIDINEKQAILLGEFLKAVQHGDIAQVIADQNDALDVVVAVERLVMALPKPSPQGEV